jgi:hypothetical protein
MAGGRRAEREVQVRDSAERAIAVVMPIDFRTMRDTSDGGATTLFRNGRPCRAGAQSRGSILSMSASPVGTSGSLSHSETITVVFTARMVPATQGPHVTRPNYRKWGDALSLDRHGQRARTCRPAGFREGRGAPSAAEFRAPCLPKFNARGVQACDHTKRVACATASHRAALARPHLSTAGHGFLNGRLGLRGVIMW